MHEGAKIRKKEKKGPEYTRLPINAQHTTNLKKKQTNNLKYRNSETLVIIFFKGELKLYLNPEILILNLLNTKKI